MSEEWEDEEPYENPFLADEPVGTAEVRVEAKVGEDTYATYAMITDNMRLIESVLENLGIDYEDLVQEAHRG